MLPDYNFTLVVPADTKRDSPAEVEIKLTKGVIASGSVQFPAGCHGMVHVIIADSSGQLYPANKDDTFHYDNAVIPLVGRHKINITPYKLKLIGWSPNTVWNHTIQVSVAILTEEEISPYKVIEDLVEIFKSLLGLR